MDHGKFMGPAVIHRGGTIDYANDAFCDLVGVDAPSAVTGHSLEEFVADAEWDLLVDQFEGLLGDEKSAYGLDLDLELGDGTRTDVVAVSSPIEWEGETRIHTSLMNVGGTPRLDAPVSREAATSQSPIGVTIADATDPDEPLIYANETFVELTGYPREEVLGRNCRFLQGEATREDRVAEIRAAIDAERPATVELRNYRKDGSLFWNRLTISPVRDGAGTVTHFLGFQQDVSAAKVSEREKSLFEAHAEMSDQVMFITDVEGTIEYVNPAFERVTGYTAAEAVGKTPRILRSGHQDDAFYERMWETITDGETWESELTNRTKSGELYRATQKIVPVTDDRGEITHFTTIETDITDEQLTGQVLDVLNRILRHNVRTSVNVIDGYADLLESGVSGSEQQAAIRIIRERTAALEEISDRTTTLRNLLDGRSDPAPLSISELETMVAEFRAEYAAATIDLTVTLPDDRTIRNGAVFRIAFAEIVENAVVHTDRDARVEITVAEGGNDDTIEVRVADNGPGIPESEWEIVKTGAETPLQHANSIGIWLIYWSVTASGGAIELTANEPRGSVLTLHVPAGTRPDHEEASLGSRE